MTKIYKHSIAPGATECITTETTLKELSKSSEFSPLNFFGIFTPDLSINIIRYNETDGFYGYSFDESPKDFVETIVSHYNGDINANADKIKELNKKNEDLKKEAERFSTILADINKSEEKVLYLYKFDRKTREISVTPSAVSKTAFDENDNKQLTVSEDYLSAIFNERNDKDFTSMVVNHVLDNHQDFQDHSNIITAILDIVAHPDKVKVIENTADEKSE